MSSPTISGGNFSFTATAPATGGTYTMLVQDTGTGGNVSSNSFTVTGNSITVSSNSNTTAGTAITVAGTYAGGTPAALDYSADGGNTWVAASSPTISGGAYSFSIGAGLTVGSYALQVRDHTTLSTGVGAVFAVTSTASGTALPTLSGSQVPVLHIDIANAGASLYLDTAMSVQAAVGGVVAGLKDLSTGGNNFSQAASTQRPTYQAGVKNGMPGLRFTGSAYQFLQLVANTLPTALEATTNWGGLVVFTPVTIPNSTQGEAEVCSFGLNSAANTQHLKMAQLRNSGSLYAQFSGSVYNSLSVFASLSGNSIYKAVSRWNAGTLAMAVNSIAEVTLAGTQPSGTGWNFGYIGAGADSSAAAGYSTYNANYPFDGWVHEIVLYNAALTTADRTSLLNYATAKWGN